MKMGLLTKRLVYRVCCVLYAIEVLFFVIVFLGPVWLSRPGEGMTQGLWMSCFYGSCKALHVYVQEWFKAPQGFMILALACFPVTGTGHIMLGGCLNCDCVSNHRRLLRAVTCIANIITGIFILIGVTIYGDAFSDSDLGWAFYLAIVTGILCIAESIVLWTQLGAKSNSQPTRDSSMKTQRQPPSWSGPGAEAGAGPGADSGVGSRTGPVPGLSEPPNNRLSSLAVASPGGAALPQAHPSDVVIQPMPGNYSGYPNFSFQPQDAGSLSGHSSLTSLN